VNRGDGGRSLTRAGPLAWRAGAGWLVLAGGGSWQTGELDDVNAAALGWADLDRPVAVLPTAGGATVEAEALLEDYVDLGAPTCYVVPLFDYVGAQQPENCNLIEDAGLIVIADGPEVVNLVRSLRESPAMEAMSRAFDEGSAILGVGAGASALGAWVAESDTDEAGVNRPEPGLGWLANIIVAPHFEGTEDAHRLRELLDLKQNCLGIGIPEGVGLGLGPSGDVENLGPGQVTVVVSGLEVEV